MESSHFCGQVQNKLPILKSWVITTAMLWSGKHCKTISDAAFFLASNQRQQLVDMLLIMEINIINTIDRAMAGEFDEKEK